MEELWNPAEENQPRCRRRKDREQMKDVASARRGEKQVPGVRRAAAIRTWHCGVDPAELCLYEKPQRASFMVAVFRKRRRGAGQNLKRELVALSRPHHPGVPTKAPTHPTSDPWERSWPQRGAGSESPEVVYYSGLHSGSEQFLHMQNGAASQKVFQGLEPFQPLTTMAVQMQSCDLGNSSYPAPFQATGEGDVVPRLRSQRFSSEFLSQHVWKKRQDLLASGHATAAVAIRSSRGRKNRFPLPLQPSQQLSLRIITSYQNASPARWTPTVPRATHSSEDLAIPEPDEVLEVGKAFPLLGSSASQQMLRHGPGNEPWESVCGRVNECRSVFAANTAPPSAAASLESSGPGCEEKSWETAEAAVVGSWDKG
ncbi:unnamed protein product [Pleuronectes platessa]|uniref:Uncharacterized protein n=1 Tax=Pleuronectes platessa TaxID=8262 RepID=A0A9N7YVD3_PLEPL|nr:unnamed protein product [Pleuronectes platessa]